MKLFPERIQNLNGRPFLEYSDDIDICKLAQSHRMRNPVEIDNFYYVETGISVSDIIKRIKALLDYCELDYGQCVIVFKYI